MIAIKDNFLGRIYIDSFQRGGFKAVKAEKKDEVVDLISKECPDIILLDVLFAGENNFELLKTIRESEAIRKTPIILFSRLKDEGYKEKAVEFEAKDFIVGAHISPIELLRKVKTHLGKERSYRIKVDCSSDIIKEMSKDLSYSRDAKCPQCSHCLELVLLRDLSKGHNYFKASFICPSCRI